MRHALTITLALLPAASFAGIPQLDPTWYGSQLFWLAVSFIALVLVVRGSIAPGVGKVLATRAQAIAEAIAEANAFRARAENAATDTESSLTSARNSAAQLTLQAQQEALRASQIATEKLEASLSQKLSDAEKSIGTAKENALAGLQPAAASLAAAMAEKLLGVSIAADVATNATKKIA